MLCARVYVRICSDRGLLGKLYLKLFPALLRGFYGVCGYLIGQRNKSALEGKFRNIFLCCIIGIHMSVNGC